MTGGRDRGLEEAGEEIAAADGVDRPSPSPLIVATELPGKGLGYVAAEDISRGTKIFDDHIIASSAFSTSLRGALRTLVFVRSMLSVTTQLLEGPYRQLPLYAGDEDFKFDLPRPAKLKERFSDAEWSLAAKRVRLNCFMATLSGGKQRLELAVNTSVLNHSCAPTAAAKDESVYAIADIRAGDEVCIAYRADALCMPAVERRAQLLDSHAFTCTCQRCQSEEEVLARPDDHTWQRFTQLRTRYGDGETAGDFAVKCADFLTQHGLGEEHWCRQLVRCWLIEAVDAPEQLRRRGYPHSLYQRTPHESSVMKTYRSALRESMRCQERDLPPLHPRRMDHPLLLLRLRPDGTKKDRDARRAAVRTLSELRVYPAAREALREVRQR
eukprot:TRINITY_DN24376_c0_g1_i1.p1 TRINITY_DN24376_c0_g1~~TRINITY_DN24376_c0_g1_i1.p1  ORF type:complete len:383 (+),score=132.54 TRINITY_DN24376_c0_g1_i1:55-1203(+)